MKTPSDALFRLIKAMTKGEKIYFKKFTSSYVSSNSSTNYTKLFDAISKMSEYDEDALLKKFRKEAFVKNFVETKQYLKIQVLKALRNYGPNKSIASQLRKDLFDIEILMKKGVFDLAKTQVKKSLKLAQEYELVHYIFQLNQLQFKLATVLNDFKYIDDFVTETIPEEVEWLKKIKHSQYYWHRYAQMLHAWKKYGPMEQEEQATNLEEYPLDSFNAAHWHLIRELCIGQVFNKTETFYKDALSHYQLFKKYPSQIDLNPINYIVSIELYTNACAKVNRIEEGLEIVKEGISFLENMSWENKLAPHVFLNHLVDLYNSQLRLYLYYGSKPLFKEHHLRFKELVLKHLDGAKFFNEYPNLGAILIGEVILEDWENAEISYQRITTHKTKGHRNDIDSVTRLLGVIIYYETNNEALLEVTIDATYQFLRTKDFLFKFNRQFINVFKYKMIAALNEKERLEYLRQFRTETLAFFEENPKERNILNYFDFIAWMDSKIENCSIHEAYCKRLNAEII